MMRQMRENTKWIMLVTALAFVALMVFEWGMDMTGRSGSAVAGEMGRVNGESVSYEEWLAVYRNVYQQQQSAIDGPITSAMTRQIEDALEHDGHRDQYAGPVPSHLGQALLGIEPAVEHEGAPHDVAVQWLLPFRGKILFWHTYLLPRQYTFTSQELHRGAGRLAAPVAAALSIVTYKKYRIKYTQPR